MKWENYHIAFVSLLLFTVVSMHKVRGLRVAVCGGGLSACAAANRLASNGIEVTIFEAGRGLGGRSATRRSENVYFDHGAQYISSMSKSTIFIKELQRWKENYWVKPWLGDHGTTNSKIALSESKGILRYVGVPYMNSICKNLADHLLIKSNLGRKVSAKIVKNESNPRWLVFAANDENEVYGEFDWVIFADRACVDILMESDESVNGFPRLKSTFGRVVKEYFLPVPSLVLMLSLKAPIPRDIFPYDSLHIEGNALLSWVCRDSSKPDRNSDSEQWVVQSSASFASETIKKIDAEFYEQRVSFETKKQRVNEVSLSALTEAFKDLLKKNADKKVDLGRIDTLLTPENLLCSVAHRWGAGFPSWNYTGSTAQMFDNDSGFVLHGQGKSFVQPDTHFAACGDYLVPTEEGTGIEAAVLSGFAAADGILNQSN